ncbi:sulfatase [Cyclobacterium xiamenense]|jgi:arylsulfatase A-like enzyme|uniref:sulfatase n=1 Tax=Cyclobacterium xiamenense TaxID=1297121 RepID=UPI0012B97F6B|nr:sulfatase [Cyclobacterium xiamenense]
MRALFPKDIFLVAAGILLIQACGVPEKKPDETKPNILFIAVDDLNDWAGFLSGHAGMKIHTPNIDRLAAASMVFTNAHTPAPACAPTRAAILTGVHHARSGAANVYWGDGPKWREFEALKEVVTLEQFFQQNGYKTLGAGKIYHSQAPPWSPTSQVEPANWDFYYPSPYISHPFQIRAPKDVIYPEDVDNENRPGGGADGWWTWGAIPVPDEKMADYHIVDWASYQLQQPHEKPFFLAAGMWKPHDPWEVPQKYFDMYPLEDIVLPERRKNDLEDAFDHGRRYIMEWVLENAQWEKIIQSYAASITFSDAMVGRLLDALEQSAYAENTIVVLWSDHGMHMGEKDNIEKFTLWERSTRVPLLISVPGMEQAGSRCDQPVSLMDLYPTLVELTGFSPPPHLDGRSLVPQLNDPGTETAPVVSSYKFPNPKPNGVTGHAVRSMRYRYIYYPEINLEELYDHENDPNEWDNVAYKKENTQVIEEHRNVLLDMVPELTWKDGPPEGYSIDSNGLVKKNNFESF